MKSLSDITGAIQQINILRHYLSDDGRFPNHTLLPLMVYRKVFHLPAAESEKLVLDIFESNGWGNGWKDGIYDYHHYHSTAHEVLCITQGSVRVQFGGPAGISLLLEEGDVVIIPAGVAHKNISGHDDFICVGAYADSREYDINTGKSSERPQADKNITALPLPATDPVYGMNGPLIKNWEADPSKIEEGL